MSYLLYGTLPSPFARRIRLVMENLEYEFKVLDIYGEAGAKELRLINPVNQIPVLIDKDITIWDSRQIFNYLNSFHRFQNMDWHDENLLTAIDGAMNSAVSLVLMRRSGIDLNGSYMYVQRQKERIYSILSYLTPYIENTCLKEWNFHTMSIYSFLDWALFRELLSLEEHPACIQLLKAYREKDIVVKTQIPLSFK